MQDQLLVYRAVEASAIIEYFEVVLISTKYDGGMYLVFGSKFSKSASQLGLKFEAEE